MKKDQGKTKKQLTFIRFLFVAALVAVTMLVAIHALAGEKTGSTVTDVVKNTVNRNQCGQ